MDLWAVHVKNTSISPLFHRNSFSEKPISWNPGKARTSSFIGVEDGRLFEIRVSQRRFYYSSGFRSLVVRAMGKKNNGNSSNSSSSGMQLSRILLGFSIFELGFVFVFLLCFLAYGCVN